MPQTVRSILGKSNRVKKSARVSPARQASASSPRKASKPRRTASSAPDGDDGELFPEKLEDVGLAKLLAEELTLRDVVQAMRFIRRTMFTPVPPTGLKSTRTAEVLNYRVSVPPLVTVDHLNAILRSPTLVERETAELMSKGVLRKVRVQRRGGMGEALIETADLYGMIRKTDASLAAKEALVTYLESHPQSQTLAAGALTSGQVDEMVRAGFLTSSSKAAPGSTLHVRPEDRTTLTSIQHVSRFASGSVLAVGGQNAIHLAGGGGGARALTHSHAEAASEASAGFRIAVPGHGRYLKLAEGAVDWVREALAKTKWGEGTEAWLRERFDGGGLYGTRWKDFWGVEWQWVLGEAVGLGVVEVFDTGSVGKGVRALGG